MEAILVLVWLRWGVQVPMPDMGTCNEALINAKTELVPTRIFCVFAHHQGSVSPARNMKPERNDVCIVCIRQFPELYQSAPGAN